MGDALLQKTYTVYCLTKKRVANGGTVPLYYVNNDHDAIIPRELFTRVQEEMKRRTHWSNHGKKQIVWRYVARLNVLGMEFPTRILSEVQLQNLVLEAINKVLGGKG